MGDGHRGVAVDVLHRVHPSLVLRLESGGPSVAPHDPIVDARQEHDHLTFQQLGRFVAVHGRQIDLLARLVPGSYVVPVDLIDLVAGDDTDVRRQLETFCEALIDGDLLGPADLPEPTSGERRLAGYHESAARPDRPPIGDDDLVRLALPLPLVPDGVGFEVRGHGGDVRCDVSPDEVRVLATLDAVDGVDRALGRAGGDAADEASPQRALLRGVIARLDDAGLVERVDPGRHRFHSAMEDRVQARERTIARFDLECERRRHLWEERDDAIVVVPVDVDLEPPLALATVTGYAATHLDPDAADRVVLLPTWSTSVDDAAAAIERLPDRQLVFLYSLYIWNHPDNLEVARTVRELRPTAVNIAGGPDLPKYEADCERYLHEHPEIDVAVRGEGEVTCCEVLGVLARHEGPARPVLPAALAEVDGISFVRDGSVVRTADRARLADLDQIPSPYLTGAYDHVEPMRLWYPVIETNRGCPYSCAFCDWGSATASRIRVFDLDRVRAEIDWVIDHGAIGIGIADANFGMLDRDVEIAEHLVAVRERTGRPRSFSTNMAKNRVGNTLRIVELLAGAGILTEGLIASQSYDPVVLRTIRRSNIRPAVFDTLAADFRRRELPLSTDIMLGLPGSTPATFHADLQRAIDAEVHAKAHPTQLLVNSPMNEPAYREEHRIAGAPGELVTSTATYTEDDWRQMMRTRQFFYFAERRGMLRQVATYVRAETGTPEMELYEHLRRTAETSLRHPHLTYALRVACISYLPPGDWVPLLEEVAHEAVETFGVADDAALASVLRAQLALFMTSGRAYPVTVDLDHDVVAWHHDVVAAKLDHPDGSWPDAVEPLRSRPPGRLTVDDREGRTRRLLGKSTIASFDNNTDWELDSPLARPVPAAL